MKRSVGNDLVLGDLVGSHRSLVLRGASRDKHLYIAGGTGTGKSRLLEHLIQQDILANRRTGRGVLVIDPHGSLYDRLLAWLARREIDRPIILIDLRQDDWVVAYNVLRKRQHTNPSVVVDNFVQAMAHVWGQTGTDATPLLARWASTVFQTLLEKDLTLADAMHLLGDDAAVRAALTAGLADPMARRDWRIARSLKTIEFEDMVSSLVNRLQRFLRNETLRCIFGQSTASLDFGSAIEDGAIVLVSLARQGGRISDEDAKLFATLMLTDLWTAARERGKNDDTKPFYVYIDEFQKFVTPTIAENLDEARGFGLHLTLAHQFPKQLLDAGEHGRRVYNSVMENASSKIVFRLTDPENLEPLARSLFMGVMDPDQIKHKLWSTKVMGYSEEYRNAYSQSSMRANSYAEHESTSEGMSRSSSDSFDLNFMSMGFSESTSEHQSFTAGQTHSWQQAETEGVTRTPMLIPEMGRELSHVQFRSLEEQLHRAMVALFDQQERECTARLVGMRAPVALRTPHVPDVYASKERVEAYVNRVHERWPFSLRGTEALRQLQHRDVSVIAELVAAFTEQGEARGSKRRVR